MPRAYSQNPHNHTRALDECKRCFKPRAVVELAASARRWRARLMRLTRLGRLRKFDRPKTGESYLTRPCPCDAPRLNAQAASRKALSLAPSSTISVPQGQDGIPASAHCWVILTV
jgi:hypothetical protein